MGYMGLNHMNDSDNAADLGFDIYRTIAKALKKGLKETGNSYNTSGPINVALVFEAMIIPNMSAFDNEDLYDIADQTIEKLGALISDGEKADWDNDAENKTFHLKSYKRMLISMKKFAAKRS